MASRRLFGRPTLLLACAAAQATGCNWNSRVALVHKECCDEPAEDCHGGAPKACNLDCAKVFLSFERDCGAQYASQLRQFHDVHVMCQATSSACAANPCHNRGKCVAVSRGDQGGHRRNLQAFACICPRGYSGVTCDQSGGGGSPKQLQQYIGSHFPSDGYGHKTWNGNWVQGDSKLIPFPKAGVALTFYGLNMGGAKMNLLAPHLPAGAVAIVSINMDHNQLTDQCAPALARAIAQLPNLQSLNLFNNKFADASPVTSIPKDLKYLNLGRGHYTDKAAPAIAAAIAKAAANLRSLNLEENHFSDASAAMFAKAIGLMTEVKELSMANNQFSDKTAPLIADALSKAKNLQFVDMESNKFSERGCAIMRAGVKKGGGKAYVGC